MPNETSDRTIESLRWAHELGAGIAQRTTVDGVELLIAKDKQTIISLEEFAEKPRRIKTTRSFILADSFAAYLKDFANDSTKLFGSVSHAKIGAVLDYHKADEPSWCTHTAELLSVPTPEWAALKAVNGKKLSQVETAEWLEEWSHIVSNPEPAAIAQVALNLQGSANAVFESKINRHNGSATFTYREEVDTGQVRVPDQFAVQVAPFAYSELTDVLVLLRFRIEDKRPRFMFVIQNVARIEQLALQGMFSSVEQLTGKQVLVTP